MAQLKLSEMARTFLVFLPLTLLAVLSYSYIFLAPQTSFRIPSSISDGSLLGQKWNLLYHLGGNNPWIEKKEGVREEGIAVPDGCRVEQVHMLSRHGERYPTLGAGIKQLAMLSKLKEYGNLKGSLGFANTWQYITPDPSVDFEQLTRTGPYAGILQAFNTGVKLRTRYAHLVDNTTTTRFWSTSSPRVIDTARYFAAGFFGLEYESSGAGKLVVIDGYDPKRGADTLTPGKSCTRYKEDTEEGRELGVANLYKYQQAYLRPLVDRFAKENPGLELSVTDVYAMQELCGFELLVSGSSPWCEVFTNDQWRDFEYARDLIHYYRSGSGNKYGKTLGWLWLNATATLMRAGPEAGGLFLSFAHDGDLIPLISAMRMWDDEEKLPNTHNPRKRKWKTSDVVPMGGRIIFEVLACEGEEFVRLNVNDGVLTIPGCESGPGGSCPRKKFMRWVAELGKGLPEFKELCGLDDSLPERITFLKQPGKRDAFAEAGL